MTTPHVADLPASAYILPTDASVPATSWIVPTDLLRSRLEALIRASPSANPRVAMEVLGGRIRFASFDIDPMSKAGFNGARVWIDYDVSSASCPPEPFSFLVEAPTRWLRSSSRGPQTEITLDGETLSFRDPANPGSELIAKVEQEDNYAVFPLSPDGIHTYLRFHRKEALAFGRRLQAVTDGRSRFRDGYVQVYLGARPAGHNVSFRSPDREFLLTTHLQVSIEQTDDSRPPEWVTIPAWFFLGMAYDAASLDEGELLDIEIQDDLMLYHGRTIRIQRNFHVQTIVDPVPLVRALGFRPHDVVHDWIVPANRFVAALIAYQAILENGLGVRVRLGVTRAYGEPSLELGFAGQRCGAVERLPLVATTPVPEIEVSVPFDLDLLVRGLRHGSRPADALLRLSLATRSNTLRIADLAKPGDPPPFTVYLAPTTDDDGFRHDD